MDAEKTVHSQSHLPKWGNFSDEQLRKVFIKEAKSHCQLEMEAFADCMRTEGFLAFYKCQGANKKQNECTRQWATQERWNEYRLNHIKEYISKGQIQPMDLSQLKEYKLQN